MAGPLFNQPSRPSSPPAAPGPLTVTQLNSLIRQVLGDTLPDVVHLVAEISNRTRHTSGHLYLTLKDARSEIRAVMWKSAAASLRFDPRDGLEVLATGRVDLYEARGQVQFYINRLEPRGVGALELAFRQLQEKLRAEGLFDPARKKPVPRFPRRIAVVTSPTGAAIRDILQTLRRRWGCATVFVHPVRVQGEGAAGEIAAAIGRLNAQAGRLGGLDVMIVARGGGSLEDLWAFNEEQVARAIAASVIPVISGVGHEVDITIADLVADLRAPTPTGAAELAAPVLSEVLDGLSRQSQRMRRCLDYRANLARSRIDAVSRVQWLRDPLGALHRVQQRMDELETRLDAGVGRCVESARRRLHRAELKLIAARPEVVLRRRRTRLMEVEGRLRWAVLRVARTAERRLDHAEARVLAGSPKRMSAALRERLDQVLGRIRQGIRYQVATARREVSSLAIRVEAMSPQHTLARGYSVTRTPRGKLVTSPADVSTGDKIRTETAGGTFDSRVTDAKQLELFE